MDPIAVAGTNAKGIALLGSILTGKGYEPWILWNATSEQLPGQLAMASRNKVVTFKACVYVAECQILATHRILDRTNRDYVWIVDSDVAVAKDLPDFLQSRSEDVLLGTGVSRFSRKALECIAMDFGMGLDYSGLNVAAV